MGDRDGVHQGENPAAPDGENPDKLEEYMERFVNIQLSVHEKKAPLLNKLKGQDESEDFPRRR